MISNRVLTLLEWPEVISNIIVCCDFEPAKKILLNLSPLNIDAAANRLKYISEIKKLILINESPDFTGMPDIENQLEICSKEGILNIDDIIKVKNFLSVSRRIFLYIQKYKTAESIFEIEYHKILPTGNLLEFLNGSVSDAGELSEDVYPKLKDLKHDLKKTKTEIEKHLLSIIHNPANEKAIQEKIFTTRSERYVVLVKSAMRGKIKGNIHDFSTSGATIFIEPHEIISLNNKIILLKKDLDNEILRILRLISKEISFFSFQLNSNYILLIYLNAVTSLAKFSIKTESNPPELIQKTIIKLYSARHPLLQLLIPEKIISNDFELGIDYDCLIISGANTGGKTALLKMIGLCVHMAACGLHIPAGPDSKIGIFSNIMADIGDDQNISESLSTFSGQIVEINRMLESADDKSLILLDEIMAGTNPDEGTLLASAILESLADRGAKIIVATHYPGLKELQSRDKRFMNGSVIFDLDSLKPVYKLRIGLPGLSYAIEIAKIYGLPDEIITKAIAMKDNSEQSVDFLLERVQRKEIQISDERVQLDLFEAKLKKKEDELLTKESEIRRKIVEINSAEGNRFISELNNFRKLITDQIESINNFNINELSNHQHEIGKLITNTHKELIKQKRANVEEKYESIDENNIRVDDIVYIFSLEKNGLVQEIDFQKLRAKILFGNSITSYFKFSDLLIDKSRGSISHLITKKKINTISFQKNNKISVTVQTSYNTIDIRGKRVEEGIVLMENELDRMMRSGISAAIIIHGHGTGALKEAVRSTLKNSYYCDTFRNGEQSEGGDGVTIVKLSI